MQNFLCDHWGCIDNSTCDHMMIKSTLHFTVKYVELHFVFPFGWYWYIILWDDGSVHIWISITCVYAGYIIRILHIFMERLIIGALLLQFKILTKFAIRCWIFSALGLRISKKNSLQYDLLFWLF